MPKVKSRKSKHKRLTEGALEPTLDPSTRKRSQKQQSDDQVDENIGHMDTRLLADLFARQIKRHYTELTAVEMNDLYVPSSAFRDTSDFSSTRNLDSLAIFLQDFTSGGQEALSTTCEETGSPHTLLVTSSGIRAADITRSVVTFSSSARS